MRVFCTYFDHHYLPRGLALYGSLKRHCRSFQLWVLCLSQPCYEWLEQKGYPELRLIRLEELEAAYPQLLKVKSSRTIVEYYFTCSPSLPRYVLDQDDSVELVTYLDSDLYFFRDPEPLFNELGKGSIAIIEHRFAPQNRHLENTGIYNVGWVSFRRDDNARACLNWWQERCLEWCHDRVEEGRYGDQKYLDQWPKLFRGVIVLQNKGANLAPWNLANYRLSIRDERVYIDEDELVFFHYHGFQQVTAGLYEPNLIGFGCKPSRMIHRHLMLPYWHALHRAYAQLQIGEERLLIPAGLREAIKQPVADPNNSLLQSAWSQLRHWHRLGRCWLKGKYVFIRPKDRKPIDAADLTLPAAQDQDRGA